MLVFAIQCYFDNQQLFCGKIDLTFDHFLKEIKMNQFVSGGVVNFMFSY